MAKLTEMVVARECEMLRRQMGGKKPDAIVLPVVQFQNFIHKDALGIQVRFGRDVLSAELPSGGLGFSLDRVSDEYLRPMVARLPEIRRNMRVNEKRLRMKLGWPAGAACRAAR